MASYKERFVQLRTIIAIVDLITLLLIFKGHIFADQRPVKMSHYPAKLDQRTGHTPSSGHYLAYVGRMCSGYSLMNILAGDVVTHVPTDADLHS